MYDFFAIFVHFDFYHLFISLLIIIFDTILKNYF
jgi:hypothetical protein